MGKTIDDVKAELSGKNIPVVVLDQRWHQLFPEKMKTAQIKKLEKELMGALKRQGQVNNDIKSVKKIKNKLMQDVLDLAEADIPAEKKAKMQEQNQKLILEAKEKMDKLEDEALELPKKIRDLNLALATESVDVCYKRINRNYNDIKVLTRWIDEARIELKKKILIKQDKEIKNTEIYTYLHDLLGPEVMEVFDEKHS